MNRALAAACIAFGAFSGCDSPKSAPAVSQAPTSAPTAFAQTNSADDPAIAKAMSQPWLDFTPVVATPPEQVQPAATSQQNRIAELAELSGHRGAITQISVALDGSRAISCDREGDLFVWDVQKKTQLFKLDVADHGKIRAVAISPDGAIALVAGEGPTLSKWDLTTGKRVGDYGRVDQYISAIEFSPDPRIVALIEKDERIVFCRTDYLRDFDSIELSTFRPPSPRRGRGASLPAKGPWLLRWNRSGTTLVVARSNLVRLFTIEQEWHAKPINETNGIRQFHERAMPDQFGDFTPDAGIVDIAITAKGKHIAFALANGQTMWRKLTTGIEEEDFVPTGYRVGMVPPLPALGGSRTSIASVAVLPGDRYLARYNGGQSIDLWNIRGFPANGGHYGGDTSRVSRVAFLPDGRHALCGFDDGRLVLYELPRPLELDDGRKARQDLEAIVRQNLGASRYDALEQSAKSIREKGRILPDGQLEYAAFQAILTTPAQPTEDGWSRHLQRLAAWVEAHPKSGLAKTALGCALARLGQVTRGSGDESQLTFNRDRAFQGQFNAAGELLAEALTLDATDPAIFHATILAGHGMGVDNKQLRLVFDKGVAAYPKYLPLYTAMAACLLPTKPGERGDVGSFLDELANQHPGDDGLALVTMIVGELREFVSSSGEFAAMGVDMQKVDAGAEILVARYPSSIALMNLACWRACERGDQHRAAQLFAWIGSDVDVKYWSDERAFGRLRSWAWREAAPNLDLCILAGMSGVDTVAFSPDGATLAAGSAERMRQVTLWDAGSGKLLRVLPHRDGVVALAFSPDGRQLASGGGEGVQTQLVVWTLGDNEPTPQSLKGPLGLIRCLRFSPNGAQLIAGGDDDDIWIWSVADLGAAPQRIKIGGRSTGLDISPDGRFVGVASERGAVRFDLATRTPVARLAATPDRRIYLIDVSLQQDQWFLAGGENLLVRWPYDGSDRVDLSKFAGAREKSEVSRIDVSSDGRFVAAALNPPADKPGIGKIVLVDLKSGNVVATFRGHGEYVSDVKFSPDGKRLATAGRDGTVQLWRLTELPPAENSN